MTTGKVVQRVLCGQVVDAKRLVLERCSPEATMRNDSEYSGVSFELKVASHGDSICAGLMT